MKVHTTAYTGGTRHRTHTQHIDVMSGDARQLIQYTPEELTWTQADEDNLRVVAAEVAAATAATVAPRRLLPPLQAINIRAIAKLNEEAKRQHRLLLSAEAARK
jgi:hypothetical protein